jgi:hypothetical protein
MVNINVGAPGAPIPQMAPGVTVYSVNAPQAPYAPQALYGGPGVAVYSVNAPQAPYAPQAGPVKIV